MLFILYTKTYKDKTQRKEVGKCHM